MWYFKNCFCDNIFLFSSNHDMLCHRFISSELGLAEDTEVCQIKLLKGHLVAKTKNCRKADHPISVCG